MIKLPHKIALTVSAVVSSLLLNAHGASADVGPMEPARAICMGSAEGTPCTFEGKKGTCQGPHPSRMYCTPIEAAKPPSPDKPVTPTDPVAPVTEPAVPPSPTTVEPAKPTQPKVLPATPSKPPRKSGCAVTSSQNLPAPLTLVGVVLGMGWLSRRRRGSRSGA